MSAVEVDLQFDLKDYLRASTRLLFTQSTFLAMLVLVALAILYGLYSVVRNAGLVGFGPALAAQAPFLLFAVLPLVTWFSLRQQGRRLIANQRATGERIHYSFSDAGFVQRATSSQGEEERSGGWETFARVIETSADFLLLLPRRGGVFLPKTCFASQDDVVRFREIVRSGVGKRAKLQTG